MNSIWIGTEAPSPAIVTKIEAAYMLSTDTDEASATAAGRGFTLTVLQDMANLMQAACGGVIPNATGYILSSSYMILGQTYTPSIRITDSMAGLGTWQRGQTFTVNLLGLTAYTNTGATLNSTVFKLSPATAVAFPAGTGKLVRAVTLPSSGTYTYSRWFSTNMLQDSASNNNCFEIFGILNSAQTAWLLQCTYIYSYNNVESNSGIYLSNPIIPNLLILPYTSMGINTWYLVNTVVNYTDNTVKVLVYAADGATLLASSSAVATAATLAGITCTSRIGQFGSNPTCYIDGIVDGI